MDVSIQHLELGRVAAIDAAALLEDQLVLDLAADLRAQLRSDVSAFTVADCCVESRIDIKY